MVISFPKYTCNLSNRSASSKLRHYHLGGGGTYSAPQTPYWKALCLWYKTCCFFVQQYFALILIRDCYIFITLVHRVVIRARRTALQMVLEFAMKSFSEMVFFPSFRYVLFYLQSHLILNNPV